MMKPLQVSMLAIGAILCGQHVFAVDATSQNLGDNLDQKVAAIIQAKCARCHDDLDADAASGVDDLLNLDVLAISYLDAADEEYVNDLVLGTKPRMPKPQYNSIKWDGPLDEIEKETLLKWVQRGGPSTDYGKSVSVEARKFFSFQSINDAVAKDLQQLNGAELENARYLTLTNAFNDRSVSPTQLDVFRAAIVKTLNSLSQSADGIGLDTSDAPQRIVAVDPERTIFRFDLRQLNWTKGKWDLLAKHYPFGMSPQSGSERFISTATTTQQPILRADWFVFTTLQPPLYHELLDIPDTLQALEAKLQIDRLGAIRDRTAQRSGMVESKVSVNNRLLERIPMVSRSGVFHISYDFASNTDEQNFRDFPLGPVGAFSTRHAFRHDGGEIIYSLPNGYQAYMLVDGTGRRLDIAPQAIVQDRTMPGSVIINGVSCLSCHYQGMKPEQYSPRFENLDVVRASVEDNTVRFTAQEQELALELYPPNEVFRKLVEVDRKNFLTALERTGIPQNGATEPARTLFDYFKNDLNVDSVATELGLASDDLVERLNRESETRQVLSDAQSGVLKRQNWLSRFARVVRLAGIGSVEQSIELPIPYFGNKVTTFARNEAVESITAPGVGQTGIDLIDAENRDGHLRVDMWTEDQQRNYIEGEKLVVRVRATEDSFLTLLSVDSEGQVTLLVPNAWHPTLELTANQIVSVPTADMPFEFATTPPHGPTLLKAIVTSRPLDIKGAAPQTLRETGLLVLGRSRSKGFTPVQRNASSPERSTVQSATILNVATTAIEQQFRNDEWATTSFTVTTRPR